MNSAIARLLSLRVADVMRRAVVTLPADGTLAAAAARLLEHDISGAPVVDEAGLCVGVLSAVDFVRHEVKQATADKPQTSDAQLAREHMTVATRSVAPDSALLEAAREMCDAHLHRLPVLDRAGKVVGMISSLDIVAALVGAIDEWET